MINLLLVDDHDLVRMGIKRLLADADGIKVVAEANSGEQAVVSVRSENIDVVLMDVRMPGIGGLEATRRLLRINPDLKIIALTSCGDDVFPTRILQAGAMGYLTKGSTPDEMITAIKKVAVGQRYISSEIAHQLALKHIHDGEGSPFEILSEREHQIMTMITTGQKVQDISDKLCLSPKTVNSYRYRLFEKLNVSNDVELTHLAIRHGLLDDYIVSDKDDAVKVSEEDS